MYIFQVETLTDKPSNSSEATAVIMQHGHLVSHDPDESVSSLTISLREHHRPSGINYLFIYRNLKSILICKRLKKHNKIIKFVVVQ